MCSFTPSDSNLRLKVGPHEILKLSFTVFDDKSGEDVQPHQTFLRFWDEATKEEGIIPLKVSKDGKAKFSLVRHTLLRAAI